MLLRIGRQWKSRKRAVRAAARTHKDQRLDVGFVPEPRTGKVGKEHVQLKLPVQAVAGTKGCKAFDCARLVGGRPQIVAGDREGREVRQKLLGVSGNVIVERKCLWGELAHTEYLMRHPVFLSIDRSEPGNSL